MCSFEVIIHPLNTMARYALIFLAAAALLCTAVLAQDVTPAHKGQFGSIYSSYDSYTQRYRPVACGRSLCLYRIRARFSVDTYHRNQPGPGIFANTVAVYTGTVRDYTTNVTTGTFEVSGIATTQPAGPTDTLDVIENYVIEFGPDGGAMTATGISKINPISLTITDSAIAVTGGTGQFLGAYGTLDDTDRKLSSQSVTEWDITVYVPSNKL